MTKCGSPLRNDVVGHDLNVCGPDYHVATPVKIYYDYIKNDRKNLRAKFSLFTT
jgi:hypothetical protein